MFVLLLAACGGKGTTNTDDNPLPAVTSVTPASVAIGAPAFTLTVDGSSFGSFSTVRWNGSARPTTVVSSSRLTAAITATDVAEAGTASVTVVNAGPGGGTSAARTVTITGNPVGSVVITPVSGPLVPTQSLTLQATVKAPSGSVMSGQSVTWSSSSEATATVNGSGVVTAVTVGAVTITATSGGVPGSIQLTVVGGAMVGASGGAVNVGAASIAVPAGAVTVQTAFTAVPVTNPPPHPDLIAGTGWALGPSPSTFAQPVTVSIGYPANLPGVDEADLVVHRWTGTVWQPLANRSVNAAANIASGTTTQFSTFAVIAVASAQVWTRVMGHPLEAWAGVLEGWTEALGRTWIVTGDSPPMLRSTTDGINWTSLDPTTVGLPVRPGCGNGPGSCWPSGGNLALAGTSSELVITTMLRFADGSFQNEVGHNSEVWAIRGNGQNWTVQGPTTPGLNQYTPPPSARNFRVTSIVRGAAWGDRFIAAGVAQWWLPFSTSDASLLSFTTTANAGWQMYVRPDQGSGGNPPQNVTDVVGTPMGFFAVGALSSTFQLWHTTNGTDWTTRTHPASQVAGYFGLEHSVVLYGPSGLVVARRTADSKVTTWHSVNGTSWTQSQMNEVSTGSTRGLVAAGKYILHAVNDDRVWISDNGQTWQPIDNSPSFQTILAVGNKLLGITLLGAVWELNL